MFNGLAPLVPAPPSPPVPQTFVPNQPIPSGAASQGNFVSPWLQQTSAVPQQIGLQMVLPLIQPKPVPQSYAKPQVETNPHTKPNQISLQSAPWQVVPQIMSNPTAPNNMSKPILPQYQREEISSLLLTQPNVAQPQSYQSSCPVLPCPSLPQNPSPNCEPPTLSAQLQTQPAVPQAVNLPFDGFMSQRANQLHQSYLAAVSHLKEENKALPAHESLQLLLSEETEVGESHQTND